MVLIQRVGGGSSRYNVSFVESDSLKSEESTEENKKASQNERGDIVMLEDGNTYVSASRKIISGSDINQWRRQISGFFGELLGESGSLDVPTVEGDVLTITKAETANKARDNYKQESGKRVKMTAGEFRVKLNAEAHIDELAETAKKQGSGAADSKNHTFAKDGFAYRTAYFQDHDGEYYRITLSIGNNGDVATVYNVGKIKKDTLPATKIIAARGSTPHGNASSDNSISQKSDLSTENGEKISAENNTDGAKASAAPKIRELRGRTIPQVEAIVESLREGASFGTVVSGVKMLSTEHSGEFTYEMAKAAGVSDHNASMLAALSDAFAGDLRIYFDETDGDRRGVYRLEHDGTRSIVIDPRSVADMNEVITHEIFHDLEATPAGREFIRLAEEYAKNQPTRSNAKFADAANRYEQIKKLYESDGRTKKEDIPGEVGAKVAAELIGKESTLEAILDRMDEREASAFTKKLKRAASAIKQRLSKVDKKKVRGAALAERRADMMLELYTRAAKQRAVRNTLDNPAVEPKKAEYGSKGGKKAENSELTTINDEKMHVSEESSQKDAEKSPKNKKASREERADVYESIEENQDIISLVEKVESGAFDPKEKIDLGTVPDGTALKIEKLTGINVKGFKVAIEARQINHILIDHGKNGKTDHSMSDSADIAKMEYAMQNSDDISLGKSTQAYKNIVNGKTQGAKTVLYEKSIGAKSYYVVQAVPDTKAKTLFVVSAFIGEKGYKKGASQFTNAESLGATSEIGTANASNNSIPQNSDLSTGNEKFDLIENGEDVKATVKRKPTATYKAYSVSHMQEILKGASKLITSEALAENWQQGDPYFVNIKTGGIPDIAKQLSELYNLAAEKGATDADIRTIAGYAAEQLIANTYADDADFAARLTEEQDLASRAIWLFILTKIVAWCIIFVYRLSEENMSFVNAKRIWINDSPKPEEYGYFTESFDFSGESVSLEILAETDYIAYVNGERAAYLQFAGYPSEKYYDTVDITKYCREGKNTLEITARYEGINSACHIDDGAGLMFSVFSGGREIVHSSENTLCAPDARYVGHEVREITCQLGLTSSMDARTSAFPLHNAVVLDAFEAKILPRPVGYLAECEPVEAKPMNADGKRLFDLGDEYAGYLFLTVKCEKPCNVKVAYGEHIEDGGVRRIIGARDFSLDFHCAAGENRFEQFFVRLSARYLEVFCDEPIKIERIGLIPVLYPVTEKPCKLSGLDREIYDACVHTLRLCMHTHYEDCPWREQALYALDSRNQMLCGYTAFEESEFQRANLLFISKGKRPNDTLLELTYPAINTPAIPFFSVMYPVAVYEYVKNTGDQSIIPEVMETMRGIMQSFAERVGENGLIKNFPKPPYWNFYEWSEGSNGRAPDASERCDLILNCAFIYSAERFIELCSMVGESFKVDLAALRAAVKRELFNEENGFFHIATTDKGYSRLGNAFAVLAGLGDKRTLSAVKGETDAVDATLSMLGYIYDAILENDENGKDFVLADIREKYGYMLSKGTTTFWETLKGAEDFHLAGSLCHGWSAMPIVYFKRLMPECF